MSNSKKIIDVLRAHLDSRATSFSIGSFGAIAEFHRDFDESLTVDRPDQLLLATPRGAIRIVISDGVQPLAYETLSAHVDRWQQGVAFCLPTKIGKRSARNTITELGPDRDAIQTADRDSILFDLGLGAANIDFCVTTSDPSVLALFREINGQSYRQLSDPVWQAIIESSPTRVVLSNLGRIEVYQAIGVTATPDGPHTHLLPKLLSKNRSHSANIPIPNALLPCLTLHPPNQTMEQSARPDDPPRSTDFETLLNAWGLKDYIDAKRDIIQAVANGGVPADYPKQESRIRRTALRIALRQMCRQEPTEPQILEWRRYFENLRVLPEDGEDSPF